VHYWADLQSVHGFRCYDNIAQTRNVSEWLVLAVCLVIVRNHMLNFFYTGLIWKTQLHAATMIQIKGCILRAQQVLGWPTVANQSVVGASDCVRTLPAKYNCMVCIRYNDLDLPLTYTDIRTKQ